MLVVAVDQETPQEAQQEPVVEQVAAAQVHQVLVQKELMELLLLVVVAVVDMVVQHSMLWVVTVALVLSLLKLLHNHPTKY
jgi:hypothetical protein